jgi:CRP/FNR family transcriptional regulator, polysaccharide utilization system transcription regulator
MQFKDPYIELVIEGATSILRGLSQTEKELLDNHHQVINFRKGDTIANPDTKLRGPVCLASGKVKVFRIGAGNREQIIKMVRPFNFISYSQLFSDSSCIFSAVAIEESSVVVFEKNTLNKILRQNAELAFRFMKAMSDDLLYSNNRMVSLTQKHVRGRIAESILLLCDTYGVEADGRTLRVMISREDLAHLSNMTTSNAIRTLSGMVSEKILETGGRKIIILNFDELEAISESGQ